MITKVILREFKNVHFLILEYFLENTTQDMKMLLQSEFEMFPNTSMRDYFEEAVQNLIKSDPSSTPEINNF